MNFTGAEEATVACAYGFGSPDWAYGLGRPCGFCEFWDAILLARGAGAVATRQVLGRLAGCSEGWLKCRDKRGLTSDKSQNDEAFVALVLWREHAVVVKNMHALKPETATLNDAGTGSRHARDALD